MVEQLIDRLRQKGLTVAAAESCTGGLISSAFVDISGASDVFAAGLVTYMERCKVSLLGVEEQTLESYTAVSAQTAEEMCVNAAKRCGADIGLSSTGYAGPDGGTQENPVGTVYIGVYIYGKAHTARLELSGGRTEIRRSATAAVLAMLNELL